MNNRKNIVHERRDSTKVTFKEVEDYARVVTGRPRLQIGRILGGPPGWHMKHLDKVQVVHGKEMHSSNTGPKDVRLPFRLLKNKRKNINDLHM